MDKIPSAKSFSSLSSVTTNEENSATSSPVGHLKSLDGSSQDHTLTCVETSFISRKSLERNSLRESIDMTPQETVSAKKMALSTQTNVSNMVNELRPDVLSKINELGKGEDLAEGNMVVVALDPEKGNTSNSHRYVAVRSFELKDGARKLSDTVWDPEKNANTLRYCTLGELKKSKDIGDKQTSRVEYSFEVPGAIYGKYTDKITVESEKKNLPSGGCEIFFKQNTPSTYVQNLQGKMSTSSSVDGKTVAIYELSFDPNGKVMEGLLHTAKTALHANPKEAAVVALLDNVITEACAKKD